MEIQKVKYDERDERKSVRLNLLTYPKVSKWMKENKVSPQKIFDEAVVELMKEK